MDTRTKIPFSPSVAAKTRRSPRLSKRIAVAVGALVLALLGWVLFAPVPLQVETAPVTQGPLLVTVNNQGQVRVHDKYVVAAPVAAAVERIELHDGDAVRRGQTVATLNPLPMDARQRQEAGARLDAARARAREAALRTERAYADLQFAISERARVERLVKGNFISPQAAEKALIAERTGRAEWNASRSREQAALADAAAAEAALLADDGSRQRPIRLAAPADGYVLKVHEKSERIVASGAPLVTVGNPDRYEIVVDVLSTDAVKIRPGNTMLLDGWGGDKVLRASVRVVEPVAFTKVSALGVEEQRVNVIADPVDPLGPLGDGYRIEARIVIWAEENVTKVAASSLFRSGDAWHVFRVEDGRAREREVKVGQRNQDEAQILSGLNAGDLLVRYPSNLIADGARVATHAP